MVLVSFNRFHVEVHVFRVVVVRYIAVRRVFYEEGVKDEVVNQRRCQVKGRGLLVRHVSSVGQSNVVVGYAYRPSGYFNHFHRVGVCVQSRLMDTRVGIVFVANVLVVLRVAVVFQGDNDGVVADRFAAATRARIDTLIYCRQVNRRFTPIVDQVRVQVLANCYVNCFLA